VPVWGTAAPGEQVKASLAGATATAKADPKGRFTLVLPALPAGGPHSLSVAAASGTVTAQDVLIGEVWLASGQSNMEWRLGNLTNTKADLAKADLPQLRYFTVARAESPEALPAVQGKWTVVTPSTAGECSAVAFFFARALHRELKVPVGFVNASWGGTSGEAWTPKASMEAEKALAPSLARWDAQPAAAKKMRSGGPFWFEVRGMKLHSEGETAPLAISLGKDAPGLAGAWVYRSQPGAWSGYGEPESVALELHRDGALLRGTYTARLPVAGGVNAVQLSLAGPWSAGSTVRLHWTSQTPVAEGEMECKLASDGRLFVERIQSRDSYIPLGMEVLFRR